MPLKRCTNSQGKKGWSWGDGPCQVGSNDLESKKTAIKVGIKVAGPENFSKIMKKEHSRGEISSSDYVIAKQVIFEEMVKGGIEELDSTKAYIPANERNKVADDDFGGPNKSFPIRNQKDVEHAAMLLHHAADPSAVKNKIKSIIKRKRLKEPDSWLERE